MPPPRLRGSGNQHLGRKGMRNRVAMRGTGSGAIKTCPRRNRSANFRMILHFAVCPRKGSKFFGNDCSISPPCRRNSSYACSTAWRPGNI